MNNKKTDNYKNYKYVYTGHKDYCKNHNIKTTPTKVEQNIVHDHRFKFNFNNPNEHYHDYSFDFNNPNEHQHDYSFDLPLEKKKTQKTTYQTTQPKTTYTKTTTTSPNKTITTTTYQNKTTTTKTTTNKKNNSSGCGCLVAFFFFFVFFSGFIGIMEEFFEETNNDYNYNYNYDYEEEDSYERAIDDYILAIEEQNYLYIEDRILFNENIWKQEINDISYRFPTINSIHSQVLSTTQIEEEMIPTLENSINSNIYGQQIEVDDAYTTYMYFTINGQYIYKNLVIAEINDYWYLIESF